MIHTTFARTRRLMTATTLAASLVAAGLGTAWAGQGTELIVVVPENTAKPASLSTQVAKWRQELGAANVTWVDSVKREKPSGFGSMAVLNFESEGALEAWKKSSAASLGAPLQAVGADTLTEGGTAAAAGTQPVYKISYYTLISPRQDFEAWVDGYLTKYLDKQVEAGILTRYGMYLEQEQQGRALLVLEYTDAKTEQEAEPIKAKLSEDIARVDTEYARQNELKETLRTTQSWTLAVPAK